MKYISKIFQPSHLLPKTAIVKHEDIVSKSQRLMLELGVIKSCKGTGFFSFLHMGMKSLNKLINLVDRQMENIGAQKILLPTLVDENLWVKTGRLQSAGSELMTMKDRHNKRFVLAPTHEEIITDHIASVSPISPKQLPLKLYQISSKFRDEMRPRYGIIRSREFLMKDLYTFDSNLDLSKKTYKIVNNAYNKIFTAIGINYSKVEGCTGTVGGMISHEYHFHASIGEDYILECNNCSFVISKELFINESVEEYVDNSLCPKCKNGHFTTSLGLEVGHTFLLGTKYSSTLNAVIVGSEPIYMGCYGLGLSRILGASLEVLSSETELRWPLLLAPYTICIIGPKTGSKEANAVEHYVENIYSLLTNQYSLLKNDIIIDDRNHMTIGRRVLEAKRFGYPYILIIGKKAQQEIPQFEFLDVNEDNLILLNQDELLKKVEYISSLLEEKNNMNCMINYKITDEELIENNLK